MKNKKITVFSLVVAVLLIALAVLPACHKAQPYTVTFDSNGGTAVASQTVKEGDKIAKPQNPTKQMFTFDRWYSDKTLKTPFNFDRDTMPGHNLTLYAGWIPTESVMVTFDANGGTFADDDTVLSAIYQPGQKATAPAQQPTFVGFQFGGWCVDTEGETLFNFDTALQKSVTLYARWNDHPDYAYVSYYGNGKLLKRFPFMRGANLQEHAVDLTGYVVDGWYTDESMTNSFVLGTQIDDNINLYASYYTQGLVIQDGKVLHYNGTESTVVVPNAHEGQAVTTIGQYAFYRSSQVAAPVRQVVLPESITTLLEGAFYGCDYLTEVNLTQNVTELGKSAFHGDIRLKKVGDLSGLAEIPESAFLGCKSLTEITLPAGLTAIGKYAFADCASLQSVIVPAGVTYVADNVFDGCTALKTAVFAAPFQITFGKEIFVGCVSLQTITIQSAFCAEFEQVKLGSEQSPFIDCNNAKILVRANLVSAYQGQFGILDDGNFGSRVQAMN